jgi:nucleotide-binding universal stress UspA family protein
MTTSQTARKTLLVAVDLGKASSRVASRAGELARALSATIVLLHVAEPKAAPLPAGRTKPAAIAAAWPLLTPKSHAGLEARLHALAKPLKAAGIEVKTVVVAGLLADEILEQSAQTHADFIILGSHGKATQHLVSRQDALAGMLRRLKCPLIIVPVTGTA